MSSSTVPPGTPPPSPPPPQPSPPTGPGRMPARPSAAVGFLLGVRKAGPARRTGPACPPPLPSADGRFAATGGPVTGPTPPVTMPPSRGWPGGVPDSAVAHAAVGEVGAPAPGYRPTRAAPHRNPAVVFAAIPASLAVLAWLYPAAGALTASVLAVYGVCLVVTDRRHP